MQPLNEDQKKELARILDTDLFQRAKEIVLAMSDGSVEGLPLDQAAIKMSNEKGVRNAFRLLGVITRPDHEIQQPVLRRTLKHTTV